VAKLADLRVRVSGTTVVAALCGDIDLSNAGILRDELNRSISNDALGVILDLSEVTYLDSAGIHLVHRLREDLRAHGQRLKLVIPTGSMINETLRLAGLDWAGERVETVLEAERGLAAGDAAGP
jgi:anti-sigma B factor antagonist